MGAVVGARHVVVAHTGGLRTSYSFLATVTVHRGQRVAAGEVLGTTGGTGPNHVPSVVHFGLRTGDEYIDPMLLFGAVDLTQVVHLAPTDEPFGYTVAQERHGLLGGLIEGVGDGAAAARRRPVSWAPRSPARPARRSISSLRNWPRSSEQPLVSRSAEACWPIWTNAAAATRRHRAPTAMVVRSTT